MQAFHHPTKEVVVRNSSCFVKKSRSLKATYEFNITKQTHVAVLYKTVNSV